MAKSQSNVIPKALEVFESIDKPGYIDVWLRENVREIKQNDKDGNTLPSTYEYDEYMIQVLEINRNSVEADSKPWLQIAHETEVNNLAVEVRAERDRLLDSCDYTQTLDYVCSDIERNGWVAYRQALRDISDQSGFPVEIVWPKKPEREKSGDNVLFIIGATVSATEGLEQTMDQVIHDARSGLTPTPKPGEAWDKDKNYITGDTVIYDGIEYYAIHYSRNKTPVDHPLHWEVKAAPTYPKWSSIPDATQINEGTIVELDGVLWICIVQHLKSTVYKPKDGSTRWERYT